MSYKVHPRAALFDGEKPFPALSACEHFAGSEKLINKAMELQSQHGAVFDITCDCEDGAAAGAEEAHAQMVARLINSEKTSTANQASAFMTTHIHSGSAILISW